jgi:hypothetical protein
MTIPPDIGKNLGKNEVQPGNIPSITSQKRFLRNNIALTATIAQAAERKVCFVLEVQLMGFAIIGSKLTFTSLVLSGGSWTLSDQS